MRRLYPGDLVEQFCDHHRTIDDASRGQIHLAAELWNMSHRLSRRADGLQPGRMAVSFLRTALALMESTVEILATLGVYGPAIAPEDD